jgi:hypothetical protein
MTAQWGVFNRRAVKRGNVYAGTEAVMGEWTLAPYWGLHPTRNAAKARWVREMMPDLANCTDEAFMARHFDQQYRNEKMAKVMKVDEKLAAQVQCEDRATNGDEQ